MITGNFEMMAWINDGPMQTYVNRGPREPTGDQTALEVVRSPNEGSVAVCAT